MPIFAQSLPYTTLYKYVPAIVSCPAYTCSFPMDWGKKKGRKDRGSPNKQAQKTSPQKSLLYLFGLWTSKNLNLLISPWAYSVTNPTSTLQNQPSILVLTNYGSDIKHFTSPPNKTLQSLTRIDLLEYLIFKSKWSGWCSTESLLPGDLSSFC